MRSSLTAAHDRGKLHQMTNLQHPEITRRLNAEGLDILGGFYPEPDDSLPANCQTLLLLGPGPDFWPKVTASPEFADGKPDPIDRWSERVIGAIASELQTEARFPFGGPPYEPFFSWALRTGEIWSSPVRLAVHSRLGLFVSFRGAILLKDRFQLDGPPDAAPCETCHKPCLSACPAQALDGHGYDVAACHQFLDSREGKNCMEGGCLVRRACPVGADLRQRDQSAYHMRMFHKG